MKKEHYRSHFVFWNLLVAILFVSLPVTGKAQGSGLPPIKTVFVIVMENHSWSSITPASAPFLRNTLVPMGAHATQYYTPPGIHPSEPNYIWLEAGGSLGITNDDDPIRNHRDTTDHLVTYLEKAGISWKAYAEDIDGKSCPLVSSGPYATKHLPFVFFDDVTGGNNPASNYCISHIRPFTELATDLSMNTVASYNFITPNLCNDTHDCSIQVGDHWLQTEVSKILASKAYSDSGALFVTWDEGTQDSDGPIGMIVVSPLAKVNYSNSIYYTHGSFLRTIQEIFGVGPLLRDAANSTNMSDLFMPSVAVPVSINDGGIVNGASYGLVSPFVAPGSIVALFGLGLTDGGSCLPPSCNPIFDSNGKLNQRMRTTMALVNGQPSPLFYVSPNQLGLQIPTEIIGTAVSVQVVVGNDLSLAETAQVAPYAPGVFSFSGDGKGSGAVLHQNGDPVSVQKPGRRGEILSVYATGFGQVSPPVATGKTPSVVSATLAPTLVTVDGITVLPSFSGLAGCCVGLNQVNFLLPAGVRSGSGVPLSISVAGVSSNTVNIAVE